MWKPERSLTAFHFHSVFGSVDTDGVFSKYSKRNIVSAAAHLNINQITLKNESLINYPIKTEKDLYQYVPG